MMRLQTDEDRETLIADGAEVSSENGEVFDLIFSDHGDIRFSDIPEGIKVQLCDRVIGSPRDLCCRYPQAVFEKTLDGVMVIHASVAFCPPDKCKDDSIIREHFEKAIKAGKESLSSLKKAGRIVSLEEDIYDDVAYLSLSFTSFDQTLLDAALFAEEVAARVEGAYSPPSLFLCHASEDKEFVDRLACELDKRALFAWYDKREIFVGDSIIKKVNHRLRESDFLVAVLSPRSVVKPWVVREMSSSLMRQLRDRSIRILPVVIETCDIPPLLNDIKYADFRESFESGIEELFAAVKMQAQ